jgi:hypothetical protein
VPTLAESTLPSLKGQADIALRLGVVRDSTHHFRGNIPARLTHEGLCLGREGFLVRPGACRAVCRRANRIGLEIGERHIETTVSKTGVYGDRLARDLATLLNGERGPIVLGDYRFEWYVWVLALLPVGILVLMRGGAIWGALAGAMIGLALFVAHLDRLPRILRLGMLFGVGVLSYGLLFAILLMFNLPRPWPTAIDDKLWQRFSPREEPYSVELPGKPVEQPVDLHREYLGFQARMWKLDLPAQPLQFTTSFSESIMVGGGIEKQLDAARNDLMNREEVGHLISEDKITMAGYPGREVVIESSRLGRLKGRMAVVEGRMLALLVSSPRLSWYEAEVERFFGSLRIDKGRIRPPDQ